MMDIVGKWDLLHISHYIQIVAQVAPNKAQEVGYSKQFCNLRYRSSNIGYVNSAWVG